VHTTRQSQQNQRVGWQTARVQPSVDVLAPDGSEIRVLVDLPGGSMVHCTLAPGQVTQAVEHRTVEEVWFCITGHGQLWRACAEREEVVDLEAGVAVTIPVHTRFQFRATGDTPLEVVITTMPPWPGNDEAVAAAGRWAPTV
jgi:mannose-6-phosphate isomerase-like protein (cupin superfamily)